MTKITGILYLVAQPGFFSVLSSPGPILKTWVFSRYDRGIVVIST